MRRAYYELVYMRRRNQIKLFVSFRADRSLNFVQYDPFKYITLFTNGHKLLILIFACLVSLFIQGVSEDRYNR